MSNTVDVIYKLDDINADDGIDVFEIAPILMHFGELIRSANSVLGYEQKIDIRVKPFKEGSWITQFVLQNTYVQNLINYFQGPEGRDIALLLALLGIGVKDGIVGVAGIIRFTKGIVSNFIKNKDNDKVTYVNEKGEKLEVSLAEHKLVQAPLIQNNYYNCTIAPLDKFPSATAVTIKVNNKDEKEQKFTQADKEAFEAYTKTELLEDVEDNISVSKGILIKPKRGSYSGMEQSYSFIIGNETTIWPVTIEDDIFLNKLRSGDIRLYAEDVIKVDLEVRQKKDAANKVRTNYAITKVIDYIKYEKPKQLNLEDMIRKDNK